MALFPVNESLDLLHPSLPPLACNEKLVGDPCVSATKDSFTVEELQTGFRKKQKEIGIIISYATRYK
jgi:hypothetical protein